jgi:hypothetical protein
MLAGDVCQSVRALRLFGCAGPERVAGMTGMGVVRA